MIARKLATELDEFTLSYIECALWSESLDNYGIDDIDPETLDTMIADCWLFQTANELPDYGHPQYSNAEMAGHDFLLTRNGHGAGFWDRGLGKVGDRLTKAAKRFGEVYVYVGDDGVIYSC